MPWFIAATEAESLLANQNSLIRKLKKACCTLFSKLEELTEKSRSASSFFLLIPPSPEVLCAHGKFFVCNIWVVFSISSESVIHPSCWDRPRQHSAYCLPVWPVFLLTWCYSSHSRPAQLSIWGVCVWQREGPWVQCPVSCWSCAAH